MHLLQFCTSFWSVLAQKFFFFTKCKICSFYETFITKMIFLFLKTTKCRYFFLFFLKNKNRKFTISTCKFILWQISHFLSGRDFDFLMVYKLLQLMYLKQKWISANRLILIRFIGYTFFLLENLVRIYALKGHQK